MITLVLDNGGLLQLLERPTELIGARRRLRSTTDAIQAFHHVIYFLTSHQLADALQITVTATQEEYLLDDVMLVGCYIYKLRTRAVRLILYMFCLHIP